MFASFKKKMELVVAVDAGVVARGSGTGNRRGKETKGKVVEKWFN